MLLAMTDCVLCKVYSPSLCKLFIINDSMGLPEMPFQVHRSCSDVIYVKYTVMQIRKLILYWKLHIIDYGRSNPCV